MDAVYLKDIPSQWFNIQPILPFPVPPPLDPQTNEPVSPERLLRIFSKSLVQQEVSTKKYIEIPAEVLKIYGLWRPTPLVRARNLEKFLKTKSRIYYKDESVSPAGSHKTNTAVAQAYYNKKEGIKVLTTETGAGQWGSALSFACDHFGIKCRVYMVKVSYNQKPYRRLLMRLWGAEVFASPSEHTAAGRSILEKDPQCQGSLGMAISEAIEDCLHREHTRYTLGSVLNFVLMHQTIIGMEAQQQLQKVKERPDVIIGCVGGGSNFAGIAFPFVEQVLKGKKVELIAVEPKACPSLTKGPYRYDFGDTAGLTPLLKMHSLGHDFIPSPIHAGGLRYHGMAPLVSLLMQNKVISAEAYHQKEVFEAAKMFIETEGKIPAPETSHAIKSVIHHARQSKRGQCILFNYSGHGFFDLTAYESFMDGKMDNLPFEV